MAEVSREKKKYSYDRKVRARAHNVNKCLEYNAPVEIAKRKVNARNCTSKFRYKYCSKNKAIINYK